jgi:VCBS repeat-containing protein
VVLVYDPALLHVDQILKGANVPGSWKLSSDLSQPGRISISLSGATPLASGPVQILNLRAAVPDTAPYASAAVLNLENLRLNQGAVAGRTDSAVQVVAYPGDASGNHVYSGLDAAYIARVAVGRDRGFAAVYRMKDPVIIGDVTGDGSLSAMDAALVARKAVGLNVPQIPDLPGILAPIVVSGRDPLLAIPGDLTAYRGDTLTVPLAILDDAGGLLGADIYLYYNANVFDVADGDVHAGLLTDGWFVYASVDEASGLIVVSLFSLEALPAGSTGSIAEIDFHVRADAPYGAGNFDLNEESQLNEGELVLTLQDGSATILARNQPPVAVDDAFGTSEDQVLLITSAALLANDGDPDGDLLGILSISTMETRGTLTDNGNGTFTFDPRQGFNDLRQGQSAVFVFTYLVGDGQGGQDEGRVSITVTGVNDAPVIHALTVSPDPAPENSLVSLQGTFSDPDSSGAFVVTVVDWGDGSVPETVVRPPGATSFAFTHRYPDDAPDGYAVTVRVTDDTGLASVAKTNAVIVNVAPTADAGGPYRMDAGDDLVLAGVGGDASPVDAAILQYAWDLNQDGDFSDAAGPSPIIPWAALRGLGLGRDGVYTITLRVFDGDAATEDTAVLTIDDRPVIEAVGPRSVDEGGLLSIVVSASDPNQRGLVFSLESGPQGAAIDPDTGVFTWIPADGPLSAVVTVRAAYADDTALFDTDTFTVTVDNVAPVLQIQGPAQAVGGQTYRLDLVVGADPGDDTIQRWTIDWGDGTVTEVAGDRDTASHTYATFPWDLDGDGDVDGIDALRVIRRFRAGELSEADLAFFGTVFGRIGWEPYPVTIMATATDEDGTYSANSLVVTVGEAAAAAAPMAVADSVTEAQDQAATGASPADEPSAASVSGALPASWYIRMAAAAAVFPSFGGEAALSGAGGLLDPWQTGETRGLMDPEAEEASESATVWVVS